MKINHIRSKPDQVRRALAMTAMIFSFCLSANAATKYDSESIIVTQYNGSRVLNGVLEARFARIVVVKGCPFDKAIIPIKFQQSAYRTHENIKALESKLPKRGTKWILFVRYSVPLENRMFETFRGRKGLIPYSRQQLNRVLEAMSKSNNKVRVDTSREELYSEIENFQMRD